MKRWDCTFWPTLAILVVVLVLAELTSVDLVVQDHLYDFGTQRWMIDAKDAGPRFWFYDAPKALIIVVGVGLIVIAVGPSRWRQRWTRRDLLVAFATIASVPALIGLGKATTNIFCPSEIHRYGGDVPYVRLCEPYPAKAQPLRRGRCFPAGHASGGFALFGLVGLARTERGRRRMLAVGLLAGGAMGAYQMAKGAHYLSHTVVTLLVAWWLFLLWRRLIGMSQARDFNRSSVWAGS